MFDQLRALAVFAHVAEAGSFRGASAALGLSPSVVSHHVSALERHLDTPLIYRTTRKLTLTDAGARLAVSARTMLEAAQTGLGEIAGQGANPVGRLKITAPAILQYARFVGRMSSFARAFPKVEMSVSFTDQRLNIVEHGFDIAFRVGQLADSSLMSRKLAEGRLVVCAGPEYLAAQGAVRGPGDLERLELIDLAGVERRLELATPGRKAVRTVQMRSRLSVDSGFAARRLAMEGCGVVMLPDFFVQDALAAGLLVQVLPKWRAPAFGIYAVWPPNAGTNHLRAAFLKHVANIAKTEPGSGPAA